MFGIEIILFFFVVLVFLGVQEAFFHKRNIAKIPIRIHVNGTRGKSSVVRLIAGALREQGIPTCAKTTGTLARFITDASGIPSSDLQEPMSSSSCALLRSRRQQDPSPGGGVHGASAPAPVALRIKIY
jgi:hypothetical protein